MPKTILPPEIRPLVATPDEAAQCLGISEHELKALVDAKKVPIMWIGTQCARFSLAMLEDLQLQPVDVPKVVWRKPPSPEDHAEEPFSRTLYARRRYAGCLGTWRKRVLERDDHQCRRCGCSDHRVLTAHHLKPRNRHPELALDIENGIALCENCHKIEHIVKPVDKRKYGRKRHS